MLEELKEYLRLNTRGMTVSEFVRNLTKPVLEEWERKLQLKPQSVIDPLNNSAIGSFVTNNINKNDDNTKPETKMLEQMFLAPFDEIVTKNMDDIVYMRQVRVLLKKRYEFVDKLVADADTPLKSKRLQELEEARKRDKARREELGQKEKEQQAQSES